MASITFRPPTVLKSKLNSILSCAIKKITMLLASVLGLGILTPTVAEAGCRTRCYVDHCGYTIYSEYRCVGRDCHGCPIFDWVVVSRVAPCRPSYSFSYGGSCGSYSGGYGGGHGGGYGGGYRGGYGHGGGGVHFHVCR